MNWTSDGTWIAIESTLAILIVLSCIFIPA